ncbi:MAG: hypothetical protein ACO31C_02455 [Schleiferiaceae bacterium]
MVASDIARLDALWAEPHRVAAEDLPWLESLVEAHPAAVPLWWLYLRAVQRAESPRFAQVLHRTAAISPNRTALMAWVEAPLVPVAAGSDQPVQAAEPSLEPIPVPEPTPAPEPTPVAEPTPIPEPEPISVPEPTPVASPDPIPAPAPTPAPAPVYSATKSSDVNLDALPERVREQILRARAARAQLAQVGFGTPEKAPEKAPVQAPVPSPAATPAPVVVSTPAATPPPVAVPVPAPAPTPPPAPASEPKSKPSKPPRASKPAAAVAPEPKASPAPEAPTAPKATEAASAPTAGLSPFAQFVAALGAPNSAPDQGQLIDQFLAENPRITPLAKDAPAPEVRTQPDEQVTGLVTETLARMYAEQGHVAKAIQAYEILKLRVPEKSSIFAARIEALKTK